MLISVTHLVDLVAGSQGTVGSGGWGGPDEFHTRVVPLGVKGVVGGDEDGQAVGVLSRNGKQTHIHENVYIFAKKGLDTLLLNKKTCSRDAQLCIYSMKEVSYIH